MTFVPSGLTRQTPGATAVQVQDVTSLLAVLEETFPPQLPAVIPSGKGRGLETTLD